MALPPWNADANEHRPGEWPWPLWFKGVMKKAPQAFTEDVGQRNSGDVIVGWRRGSNKYFEWTRDPATQGRSYRTMLVLGDARPTAQEVSIGEIGVGSGPVVPIWLSYLAFHHWLVLPENRGRLRAWGVLIPYTGENYNEILKHNFGITG